MTDTAVIDHRPVERVWLVRIGDVEKVAAVTVTANACIESPAQLRVELRAVPDGIDPAAWCQRGLNDALAMSACEVTAVRLLDPISWRADALPAEVYSFEPTPVSDDFAEMIDEAVADSRAADDRRGA